MIDMKGVRFGYPRQNALFAALDFSVQPGGIVGLLGKNGAGKTTLLKLGAGLLFPQAGDAMLFGEVAACRNPSVLARIAYIPEQFEVPSVRMRTYVRGLAHYYPRFDDALFERYLQRFEITGNARLNELSYGQQKKVLLSFALATGAELVVLDEPTNGLDIPSKQVFRQIAAEAADDARALIISTHQVRDVENLIDPIVILDEGRVVFEASLAAVQDGLQMRRFDSELAAEQAGALALDTRLGASVAIVPRTATAGESMGSDIDLELLFQAAITHPDRAAAACGGAQ